MQVYRRLQNIKIDKINIVALITFVINPFLAMVFLYHMITFQRSSKGRLLFFSFCVAWFLGAINYTKVLESDLLTYFEQFEMIKSVSVFEYLAFIGKEPGYYFLKYMMYYIVGGDFKVYVFIFTVASYYLLFYTIYRLLLHLKKEYFVVFAIMLIGFFPPYFSVSAHLMRQFLAASFILYFMVEYIFYDNKKWVVLLLAILTHTTCIFFVPFIFLKFLSKRVEIKRGIVIVSMGAIISLTYMKISGFFASVTAGYPMVYYIFSRLEAPITQDDGAISLIPLLLLVIMMLMALWKLYVKREGDTRLIHFLNIFLLFSLFIIFTLNQPLLSLRFYFYVYSFLPLLFFVNLRNSNSLRLGFYVFIFFLSASFFYSVAYGRWEYDSLGTILSHGILSLV